MAKTLDRIFNAIHRIAALSKAAKINLLRHEGKKSQPSKGWQPIIASPAWEGPICPLFPHAISSALTRNYITITRDNDLKAQSAAKHRPKQCKKAGDPRPPP